MSSWGSALVAFCVGAATAASVAYWGPLATWLIYGITTFLLAIYYGHDVLVEQLASEGSAHVFLVLCLLFIIVVPLWPLVVLYLLWDDA